MKIQEIIDKAKLLCVCRPDIQVPTDRTEFLETHDGLIIKTSDQYTEWHYPDGSPYNEHHLTTRFLFRTLLPNLADLLNIQIQWDKYRYVNHIHSNTHGQFDVSYMIPKVMDTEYYSESLSCGVWLRGDYNYALLNADIVTELIRNGKLYAEYPLMEMFSDFHKLYTWGHQCSKVCNFGDNNGKKLIISCDSQMIPLIPMLASIYKEVWVLDNRRNVPLRDTIENEFFDDVLIAAPALPGTWSIPKLTRYTVCNFQ